MARPKKNNADYFSHESEMRNDVKIKALRRKFSHTGYAVWNYLLEVLTDAEGFTIRWEELDIELYAADFDLDASELTEIVNYCLRLDLLQLDGNMLSCRNLTSSFSALLNKRGRNIAVSEAETSQNGSFGSRNPAEVAVSEAETHIVENSRVENSRVNNTSPRTRESASVPNAEEKEGFFVTFFFRNIENPAQEVERFVAHNALHGWKLNSTPEKRCKAAREWVPESKKERVSARFLEAWKALYAQLVVPKPDIALDMLDPNSRMTVSDGFVVIHARKSVQEYILKHNPQEIQWLAKGNKVRFSWP